MENRSHQSLSERSLPPANVLVQVLSCPRMLQCFCDLLHKQFTSSFFGEDSSSHHNSFQATAAFNMEKVLYCLRHAVVYESVLCDDQIF